MKKQMNPVFLVLIVCLLTTLLFFYRLYIGFCLQQDNLIFVASRIFKEAVNLEKEVILSNVFQYSEYQHNRSPNDIPFEEKKNWCDQSYLIKYDSNRYVLDSLFRHELVKQNLQVRSAVKCSIYSKVTFSYSDSLFYQNAIALLPVIYRLSEKKSERVEIQGYVELPFWSALKRVDSLGIIISFWLLSLFILIGGYWYLRRKSDIQEKKESELKPKGEVVKKYQMDIEWLRLTDHLLFNKRLGILKKGEVSITLIGNALKFFNMFLNAPNNSLTYKDISVRLLHRSPAELSKSDLSAVFSTVKRFRDDLIAIPNIQVDLLRRKGYRMYILTEEELAEWMGANREAEEEKQDDVKDLENDTRIEAE